MYSSNKPIKQFIFVALAALVGIIFAAMLSKGALAYTELLSSLRNKITQNQAAVAETIPEVSIPAPILVLPKPPEIITLNFVGDIMLDRGVKKSVEKNFGGDYGVLFENVSDLAEADILFGNLEGPASTSGKKSGSIYSFRMPPNSLSVLASVGFDIFNIANNHIGDWGEIAFADTLNTIASNGLKYTGGGWSKNEAKNPAIIEKNGLKIGFLGFPDVGPSWMEAKESNPGILLASDPDFDQIIKNATKQVDVLTVYFHWGEEYKKFNERQEELAHRAIDDGANLVIGSHPHVIDDTEEYGGGLIAYSLGNFIFDQKFSKETMEGLVLKVAVTKYGLKTYSKEIIKLNDFFQPAPSKVEGPNPLLN